MTLIVLGLLYLLLASSQSDKLGALSFLLNNLVRSFGNSSQVFITTTAQQANLTQSNASLVSYALSLINADRRQFGLSNVTLSNESSGQQHSQSMLAYNYFSHWDTYGMKPYMRYTLLGGTQALSENIAYRFSAACILGVCKGNINVKQTIQQMEYAMVYNDSACCRNGHRNNILDPNHNQVSIGIAYNATSVYFTEDFINNYISWSNFGVNPSTEEMYLKGTAQGGDTLQSVLITYEAPISSMTRAQLSNTSSYGYGPSVAGVVSSPLFYYKNLTSVVADQYSVSKSQFTIAFSMQDTISKNGPGEYTILVWLSNSKGNSFIGSSYTIFVGGDGKIFTPTNV